MRVASLHIHPVKSLRAVDVEAVEVAPRGFKGDRRWMVVDQEGEFVTQRTHPVMATITATLSNNGIILSAASVDDLAISIPDGAVRKGVVLWENSVTAALAGPSADDWLTNVIGAPVQLVFMDDAADRSRDSIWTPAPVSVSFADAFPILVTTTGSLDALNKDIIAHGGDAVPMARFRPNLVIECNRPWAEDEWTSLTVSGVTIDIVKPSDRCIVTTTDQQSGQRMGKEPLASLARIHRSTDPRINGVIFGTNAVPRDRGTIAVGDMVETV